MNNISSDEVRKFSDKADEWWDQEASFAPLHQLNKARLEFITTQLTANGAIQGLKVLDIGCGGGLVAEPLARLGAQLTAIDASSETIEIAKAHAQQEALAIDYRCQKLEDVKETNFDVVLAMEIVEHVPDCARFIAAAAAKIKKGGWFFLSTLNRTPESFLVAILGAEYILQKLPKGTHAFSKFVRPQELQAHLEQAGIGSITTQGALFNPLTSNFFLSHNARINYFMAGRKET